MGTAEEYFGFEDFLDEEEEKASTVIEDKPLGKCVIYQGRKNYLQHHHEEWDRNKAEVERKDTFKKKMIQEVRALSARWLRMQNVCILTGAGTSICVGGCKGNELATKTKELLSLGKGRESAHLLSQLLSLCNEDNLNFEEFLSYLGAARRCIEPSNRSFSKPFQVSVSLSGEKSRAITVQELDDLIDDIERAIAVSCNLKLTDQAVIEQSVDKKLSAHQTFIGKILSRDPTLGRVKLVTTNYDTLFEQAMDRLNVYYAEGFTGTVDRHFNPACFGLDYYYPGEVAEGRVRRYDKFLHLYKLHGSVTWRKTKLDTNNPFGLSFSTENLPSFAHALLEPQTVCFVFGYSGWDEHINRLIEDALSNPSFTLVIVDPLISSWIGQLLRSDRCERVYCISGDWGQFHKFVDELLPDVEQLKTQMEVARTLRQLQTNVRDEKNIEGKQDE